MPISPADQPFHGTLAITNSMYLLFPACCICYFLQASRPTEELYNAIVKNDLSAVYEKIEDGADVNFVFGAAYNSPEGYTPLMVACHRGRVECAKALLRAGEALCSPSDKLITSSCANATLHAGQELRRSSDKWTCLAGQIRHKGAGQQVSVVHSVCQMVWSGNRRHEIATVGCYLLCLSMSRVHEYGHHHAACCSIFVIVAAAADPRC
jgi:hypothetical protein